jgi:CheY-like chemotaxis protein
MAEKHKILVVDDEPVVIASADKILSAEGYVVRIADNAESALDSLQTDVADLMLIDLKLPKLSGIELLEIVNKQFPQIAAVVITGYTTEENAIASLQKGAFDFLPKPFSFEELLGTVQRACRFIELPVSLRAPSFNKNVLNYCRLGLHAWAKIEADGSAQLGITEIFQRTVGNILQVELPQLNDALRQGGVLARAMAEDQMIHTVWSALSGRVIEPNRNVEKNPDLLNCDPLGSGWLARIIPDNLENELANLGQ